MLAQLMDENFDTRRQLFGDQLLGDVNLRMIRCARSVGCRALPLPLAWYMLNHALIH